MNCIGLFTHNANVPMSMKFTAKIYNRVYRDGDLNRIGLEPILSVNSTITIDAVVNFNGDFHGHVI